MTECPIIDFIASADDAMRSLAADGTINLACSTAAADWCMCYQAQCHRHSAICFATSAARFEASSIQSPPHPMEPGGPNDVLVSTGADGVRRLAIAPDNSWLAAGGRDGSIHPWGLFAAVGQLLDIPDERSR